MFVSENDLRNAINSRCSCGGGSPSMGCVWCQIYHMAMAMHRIRGGLNMEAEGATTQEVVEEVEALHGGSRGKMRILCDHLDAGRALNREVDQLLQDEFGGFYESAQDDEPIGRVRNLLRHKPGVTAAEKTDLQGLDIHEQ